MIVKTRLRQFFRSKYVQVFASARHERNRLNFFLFGVRIQVHKELRVEPDLSDSRVNQFESHRQVIQKHSVEALIRVDLVPVLLGDSIDLQFYVPLKIFLHLF
jgi:hypothetical protein